MTRYRKRPVPGHTAEVQRIQKTLEDAGSKQGLGRTDVLGISGRAILKALVAGERDPQLLAELAKGKLRNKLPQLRQALRGRFGDHHGLLVGLAPGPPSAPGGRDRPPGRPRGGGDCPVRGGP